jgi:epoxide hydrolase-like predicted phosphatase
MRSAKKRKIKIVFFDFGGVFVARTSEPTFRLASRLTAVPAERIGALFSKHCAAHQVGKESLIDCWKRINAELDVPAAYAHAVSRKLVSAYKKFAKPRPAVFKLAHELKKKGVRVGLISDTCEEHARINAQSGRYRYFNPLILSHRVGAKKPGIKIFRIALRRANVKPREAVFIDDRDGNLETAKRLGFHTIHFRNARMLRRELRTLNLL